MDLRMSHGQNQVQNAFGQNHETFEDFLFNSEIVKIVDAQICDRNDFLTWKNLGQSGRSKITPTLAQLSSAFEKCQTLSASSWTMIH